MLLMMEIVVTAALAIVGGLLGVIGFFLKQTITALNTLTKDVTSLAKSLAVIISKGERDEADMQYVNNELDIVVGKITEVEKDIIKIKSAHKAAHKEEL